MAQSAAQLQSGGKRQSDLRILLRGTAFIVPHWPRLTGSVLAMFAQTGAVVAAPWLVKWGLDSYIRASDVSGLNLVFLAFVIVAAGQFATSWLNEVLMAYVHTWVLYDLRVRLFRHVQRLSMGYFDRNEAGNIMSRVQSDVEGIADFLWVVVFSFTQIVTLAAVIVAMYAMSPGLALLTLAVVPAMAVGLAVWRRWAGVYGVVQEAFANLNSELQETISGIRVVQSLNREADSIRRLVKANKEYTDIDLRSASLIPS